MVNRFRRHLARVAIAAGLAAAAPASASAAGTGDPASNRSLSPAADSYCSADPMGSSCITSALADINAAHAAEGVPAMVLPGNFASMTVPVQLLNLANLERVDRGLSPILGLSAALDQDAQSAAARDRDPMPTNFEGTEATSNWAGGYASTLQADFAWMYDDGLGSSNLDCTNSGQSGCWGHRRDILWSFSAPIAMGAGYATGQYGPSMTELFVGGDRETGPGQLDAPWVQPSPVVLGDGATAAGLQYHGSPRVSRIAAGGTGVNVSVACSGLRGAVCKLAFDLKPTTGLRIGIGRAVTLVVAAGQSKTIWVALSSTGRRLLSVRHGLRVRLVVTQMAESGGERVVLARPLTLTSRA